MPAYRNNKLSSVRSKNKNIKQKRFVALMNVLCVEFADIL